MLKCLLTKVVLNFKEACNFGPKIVNDSKIKNTKHNVNLLFQLSRKRAKFKKAYHFEGPTGTLPLFVWLCLVLVLLCGVQCPF